MANKNAKLTVQLSLAVVMVVFGIALVTTSIIVEPVGEIHYSVLTAYGETLTFIGALLGMDYSYKKHKEIKNNEGEE